MRQFVVSTLLLFVYAVGANSQQVVLTPVKDNTLYQTNDGSTSNGAGEFLFVGRTNAGSLRRALVKFDVAASVPAGATITSVSLKLNMSKTATLSGAFTVALKRVTADWGQGTSDAGSQEGQGAVATTGDATWLHRFKATANWTTAGGDFNSTVSASLSVNAAGVYAWGTNAQMVADVQDWLNTPSNNFGWIIIGDEATNQSAKRFDSGENATPGNRPQLTVTYTTPTAVENADASPETFRLIGNYPNPFNPSTQISFSLPADQSARLTIYNLLGVTVATLVDRPLKAGQHVVTWNAGKMPSGMYFARLEAGGLSTMKRMVLAK